MKIISEDNKQIIQELIEKYNLTDTSLIIVSNIKEWANLHGLDEYDDDRLALAARRMNTNIRDLIIRSEIKETSMPSILSVFHVRGLKNFDRLKNLEDFFIHTVLHEIAHCLDIGNEPYTDGEADKWALEELFKVDEKLLKSVKVKK